MYNGGEILATRKLDREARQEAKDIVRRRKRHGANNMDGLKMLVSNANCLSKREGEIGRRLRLMSTTLSSNSCVLLSTKARGTGIKLLHKCKEDLTDYENSIWIVGALVWCLRRGGRGYSGARSHAEAEGVRMWKWVPPKIYNTTHYTSKYTLSSAVHDVYRL